MFLLSLLLVHRLSPQGRGRLQLTGALANVDLSDRSGRRHYIRLLRNTIYILIDVLGITMRP